MKAIEFMPIMAQVLDNLRYFTLMGFHCSLTSDLPTATFELVVYYEEDSQKDMIIQHSTLQCFPVEYDGAKWIRMCVNNETRA